MTAEEEYLEKTAAEAVGKLAAVAALRKDDKLWDLAVRAERRIAAQERLARWKAAR